jgi:hypothetical protein
MLLLAFYCTGTVSARAKPHFFRLEYAAAGILVASLIWPMGWDPFRLLYAWSLGSGGKQLSNRADKAGQQGRRQRILSQQRFYQDQLGLLSAIHLYSLSQPIDDPVLLHPIHRVEFPFCQAVSILMNFSR